MTFYGLRFETPPQPGGPGPRIYIAQEQDGSVILPGTGFTFHPGADPLHTLSHIRLTLSALPWKRNLLLFGKPLLVAEYSEIRLTDKSGFEKT
jgi:hypothetical protein